MEGHMKGDIVNLKCLSESYKKQNQTTNPLLWSNFMKETYLRHMSTFLGLQMPWPVSWGKRGIFPKDWWELAVATVLFAFFMPCICLHVTLAAVAYSARLKAVVCVCGRNCFPVHTSGLSRSIILCLSTGLKSSFFFFKRKIWHLIFSPNGLGNY